MTAPPACPGGPEGARLAGTIEGWFSSLLVKDRGILYEDQHLQVGLIRLPSLVEGGQ